MDRDSDTFGSPPEAVERPLIDAAWAQFERLAADHKSPGADGRRAFTVPGYRLLREIHRGGQGVVYQALQESTGRKVAIKVLKEGPFADEAELARFNREADLLTRLNHPHIVAIHDRGTTGDGHAYYMMDYIPGRALDAHVSGEGLSTSEILVLFHKICEAVNAAHLRGIIHRDLKPSNIRIDEQGEPRILDFGLAKLAHDAEGSGTMTITGQFVGSLPWASPEQAEGRSDLLDVRTDVYSLGVILYQLVTRSFPYPVSGNMNEVVRNIMHASPARPTTITRGLDRDVEVILLKCLEKDAERRYQSAGELARDIHRHLKGEPIEARPASSLYQLRKFVQRHRIAVGAGFGIAAALVIATGVSIAFALRESAARDRERLALAREIDQRHLAEHQRRRAEAINQFVTNALQTADPHQGGKQAMLVSDAMLRAVKEIESGAFQDDPETEAELLRTISGILNGNARPGEALALSERALAHLRRILPADHSEVSKGLIQHASILRTLGRDLEAEPLVRESLAMEQRLHEGDHADVATSMMELATTVRHLGRAEDSLRYSREALAMRRRILASDHVDIADSLNNLSLALQQFGQYKQAESLAREALSMRRRLFPGDHPDVSQSLNNVAFMLQKLDRTAEAEPVYREALEMRRRLYSGDHPDIARTLNNLGTLLHLLGKTHEAEKSHRKALEMRQRLFDGDHPDVSQSMNNLAITLQDLGRFLETEALLRESLDMERRLFERDHPETAATLANLANVLNLLDRNVEAEAFARDALAMSRRLTPGDHPEVARRLSSLAEVLSALGRFDEAELLARKRLEMTLRLFHGDHIELAVSLRNLGRVLQHGDKRSEAEPIQRDAVAMFRRLYPGDQLSKAWAISEQAANLLGLNRVDEAELLMRESLEMLRHVLGDENPYTLWQAVALGRCLNRQLRWSEAIQLLSPAEEPARRIFTWSDARRFGTFLNELGYARESNGEFEAAEANLNEAYTILSESRSATPDDRSEVVRCLVHLYEAWDEALPDNGYECQAAEWRAKLAEITEPAESARP